MNFSKKIGIFETMPRKRAALLDSCPPSSRLMQGARIQFQRSNQFFMQRYAKTVLNEQFKKSISGLTSGTLVELGKLPTVFYEILPGKIPQDGS